MLETVWGRRGRRAARLRLAAATLAGCLAPAAAFAEAPPVAGERAATLVTSQGYRTWIWPRRAAEGRFLGFVRAGGSVKLRSPDKLPGGPGCARGFWAVEPRGYVCDDATVTLEASTDFLRNNAHTLPEAGAFPYEWALSAGAPMYARLPTPAEQRRFERALGPAGRFRPLPRHQRGHEHLAETAPIAPTDEIPAFLLGGGGARGRPVDLVRRTIPEGSMLAFTRAFAAEGRTFLLSADLTVVPADRVRRFRRSAFVGVALGGDVALPAAWVRGAPEPRWRTRGDEPMTREGSWPERRLLPLTGARRDENGERYLEVDAATLARLGPTPTLAPAPSGVDGTRFWVRESDVAVVARRPRPRAVPAGRTWILVGITAGTLVAYRDTEPEYTTLVSPGRGGLPRSGGDPVRDATTPLGVYPITFKDRAATMSPEMGEDRSLWLADVPFTQYFAAPFALHGAYWHERFGEPMSAGCVNLSPLDAHWLFEWSDPPVPPGWHGATGAGAPENGTYSMVVIVR